MLGLTTYSMGLLQAKAYRILNTHTTKVLKCCDLVPIEWALLGLLYENKSGMHYIEIAEALGVEAPFVTVMIDKLHGNKLLLVQTSQKDRRAKTAKIDTKGVELVDMAEKLLRQETRGLFKGISLKEILTYRKVLRAIVDNGSKLPENI
jgi:DNA-binding MarR family transcriptional regulator